MAKSPHFARIKGHVLRIVRAIPRGRVTTFGSIGTHLDVVPRHVAYILATLDDAEAEGLPWHRVVGEGGVLLRGKAAPRAQAHAAALQRERIACEDGAVRDFEARFLPVNESWCGLPAQTRPADAPAPRPRRRPPSR